MQVTTGAEVVARALQHNTCGRALCAKPCDCKLHIACHLLGQCIEVRRIVKLKQTNMRRDAEPDEFTRAARQGRSLQCKKQFLLASRIDIGSSRFNYTRQMRE